MAASPQSGLVGDATITHSGSTSVGESYRRLASGRSNGERYTRPVDVSQ